MPDPTGRVSHLPDFHRGVSWKQPVRVATTANGTISTAFANGQTVDGITLATGDRILLKDQTSGAANGIYTVNASGAPTRAFDMDQDGTTSVPAEEVLGAIIYVIAGTTNGGTSWRCSNTTAPTLGTTALTFVAYAAGGSPTGAASGDLAASYPNPTVAKINGNAVKSQTPTGSHVLTWDVTNTRWASAAPSEPLLLEDGTIAILESGSAAMSEPVFD